MKKKFELVPEWEINYKGHTLYRIRALRDFETTTGKKVHTDDMGGYLEHEDNLSHQGVCWVDSEAKVFGYSRILDDAYVGDLAEISGNAYIADKAMVRGSAVISDQARVYGNSGVFHGTVIENASVFGRAYIHGSATVMEHATVCGLADVGDEAVISGYASVYGQAKVYGNARVHNYARVFDHAKVFENAYIYEEARVNGDATVSGWASVYGNAHIGDKASVSGHSEIYGSAYVYGEASVTGRSFIHGLTELAGGVQVVGDYTDINVEDRLFGTNIIANASILRPNHFIISHLVLSSCNSVSIYKDSNGDLSISTDEVYSEDEFMSLIESRPEDFTQTAEAIILEAKERIFGSEETDDKLT